MFHTQNEGAGFFERKRLKAGMRKAHAWGARPKAEAWALRILTNSRDFCCSSALKINIFKSATYKKFAILLLSILLSSCTETASRLKGIGKPPPLSNIPTYPEKIADEIEEEEIAQADANYSLLNPMAYGQETAPATANSLWQPGARKFFRNKNLRSVGDILKVQITIADSASLNNSTNRTRNNTASAGTPTFFGVEKYAQKVVNKVAPDISLTDPVSLRATDSDSGNGAVSRNETIRTTIAASVVRVLPNNNLWIKGSQEVRVNFELREVTIEGMVRQEDITADNSIKLDQIAEARVSYGGRGQISDYQQPRYGKQVFDIISPF